MVSSSETQQPSHPHSRAQRLEIFLAFVAFILIGANDGALGVLIPSLRVFYQIDAATFAWSFLCSVIGYLLSSFNSGLLVEKLGQRRLILLALGVFLIGAGLISLRLPFVFYLLGALILGFGVGLLDAGLNAYVASLPKNTTLLNYLHAFYGLGALLGPLVASTLLAWQLGWQTTYITWFGIAVVLWMGLWLAFKPYVQPQSAEPAVNEEKGNVLLKALRLRVVWLAALFLLLYVGAEVSLGSWGYSFLTIARFGPALFSAWVISGYWCGLTLGRLTLANLASRLGTRYLITLCLSGVVLGLLLAWFLPEVWGAAVGLCLTGFCLGPLFPTTISLMSQIAPARLLPSAIGFMASLGSAGAALFPAIAGGLVQHLGYGTLIPLALVLTAGMFGSWLLLQSTPAQGEETR
ncbi:MAG TPA: MFS transporter [Ktedonobacteraceae bacterium]|nr:MFS transporter [Ktedonobacteraceae bacterium]